MYKIFWLTDTCFLDVDLPLMTLISKCFSIDWVIITSSNRSEDDCRYIKSKYSGDFKIVINDRYFFQLETYKFYKQLILSASKEKYDCYYLDISGMPYFHILAKHYLPVDKCVIAAHNVTTPKGARYYHLAKPYMEYIVRNFKKFQVFSRNQYEVLKAKNADAEVLYAPLCLKDYGRPTIEKPDGPVTFLFFGNIVQYKRLDILLEAVKILFNKKVVDFRVHICGYCKEQLWNDKYLPLLVGLQGIVKTDIRRIPNELIPNYFEASHYFVMPYQDIAQSGAMTVAFCYNLPVIASELDTFKEFLNDKQDGYFFESGNAESLAEKMEFLINNHHKVYRDLRIEQQAMISKNLSTEAIVAKYKAFIEEQCQN